MAYETILPKRIQMLLDGMTLPQLHTAIVQDDENSQMALWYLLSQRMREKLQLCYVQVLGEKGELPRFFEDYLSDFFIYLYEYKPKSDPVETHYYSLKSLQDNTSLSSHLQTIFKRYLLAELEELDKIQKATPSIKDEARFENLKDVNIDMLRLSWAVVRVCQEATDRNRYILLRSISSKVLEDRMIVGTPTDEEVAGILGMTYGAYRTQSSRLFQEVRDTMALPPVMSQLRATNQDFVCRLCGHDEDINDIVREMLHKSEQQLPPEQFELIRMRRREMSEREAFRLCSFISQESEQEACREESSISISRFADKIRGFVCEESPVSQFERMVSRFASAYRRHQADRMQTIRKVNQRNNFVDKLKKLFDFV